MEDWVTQLIGTVGVPSAICFVLLTQHRKTLDGLKASIDSNTKLISALAGKLGVSDNGSK